MLEATTLGAAFLAGLAVGTWRDEDDARRDLAAARRASSRQRTLDRDRWREASRRAARWIPDLAGVDF